MFTELKKFFKSITTARQSALDAYIRSKNPQNESEVNYWVQQFHRKEGTWQ